ncbi:allophanate hydrolase [Radicibacter daui]|uniref:allophanate hydrolase n=1 Tax=Radicibacter daui TaxID=3064829 RepID=UPI0040470484
MSDQRPDLAIPALRDAYRGGTLTPARLVPELMAAIRRHAERDPAVWIYLRPEADILAEAEALARQGAQALPLYGIPFAIKDNIDAGGMPTTAACPEFTYVAGKDAAVVERLRKAGALLIGKTNLDQFATGLNGTRSPYGAPRNPLNPEFVSGGSSSGSAAAVSAGLVSFSLGTDTAGSGRVPAAFCNLIGLKPTRGLIPATGVVPACRSLDCVSIFALTADDAANVLAIAAGPDAGDPYSRPAPAAAGIGALLTEPPARFTFGVPRAADLAFFGDEEAATGFSDAVHRLSALGGEPVEIDLTPFLETARLLYEGPWVAERTAAIGDFLAKNPTAGHPVVRRIVEGGVPATAVSAFRAQYRLEELRRLCDASWRTLDFILTPTAGTSYTVAEMEADPIRLNSNLGYYTNFVNLLDYAAIAVPTGHMRGGAGFGVTFIAPAFTDPWLLSLADALHRQAGLPAGATDRPLARPAARRPAPLAGPGRIAVAVVGAHMRGLPLSRQLTEIDGRFIREARTAPCYRLYAFDALMPARPGLVRTAEDGGAIALEIWDVPAAAFGGFVAGIGSPLGIGRIRLEDGDEVAGFLCEATAIRGTREITALGGWRAYLDTVAAR